MQNYCKTIGALAAVSALVAGIAQAEVEYTLHAGYSSEYLFRGQSLGKALVETGIDASTEVNGLTIAAGIWNGSVQNSFEEIDLYGSVTKDLGFADASIGYIAYAYPDASSDRTQEISFGLSRDLGFAQATLTYFWGVEGAQGSDTNYGYTELGFARSFELSPCLNLNGATNVGYYGEAGEFSSWTTRASLDYGFAEHAKLSPFVAYSVAIADAFEDEFSAGGMLSVSF
jgi:hypothetical protein